MQNMNCSNQLFKIILIGDISVGKTSLLSRFSYKKFNSEVKPTISIDFTHRVLQIYNESINILLYDTRGLERFRMVPDSFYSKSKGVMLVFSITDQNSFEKIKFWIEEVKNKVDPETVYILVGNKSDLKHKRKVSFEEAALFANSNNIPFLETSALNGAAVDLAFTMLAYDIWRVNIIKEMDENGIEPENSIIKIERNNRFSWFEKVNRCDIV